MPLTDGPSSLSTGKYVSVFIGGHQHNALGTSLYDAVSKAMDFFAAPHWRGPKWNERTVFRVKPMYGEEREYTVLAADVLKWRAERSENSYRLADAARNR